MNTLNHNYKRVWLLSDIHFGVHASSMMWLDRIDDYFTNFFIPLLQKNKQDNDVLFVLGDTFDNRININSIILNKTIEVFKKISEILPIEILIGNHDTAYKNTNDVNSLSYLDYYPNINVNSQPKKITTEYSNLLLLPWQKSNADFDENVKMAGKIDYIFCHHDFNGLTYNNSSVKIENGINPTDISDIKHIFSGHIHKKQSTEKLTMVGNPLHTTRNDMNNIKGIFLLCLENDNVEFFENKYSSRFIELELLNELNTPLDEFKEKINNNIVDLIIRKDIQAQYNWDTFSDILKTSAETKIILSENEVTNNYTLDVDVNEFKIDNVLNSYIVKLEQPPAIKQMMKDKIKELYDVVNTKDK